MPAATVRSNLLVEALIQARVLDAAHHDELAELGRRLSEPRDLGQELMRRGWLTAFQVNQLVLGRGAELVLGQYILLERIGEGGMGQVFKARQRNLNRIVALKVVRKDNLDNPKAISRFEREIRALAQLSHPNIVHAFDAGHVGGTHFYAMEYVDGVDLAKIVKQSGPLDVAQACDYIRQAALGLQHAHERGMVHRDIKPANLLVTHAVPYENPGSGLLPRPASGLLRRPSGLTRKPADGLKSKPEPIAYPWGLVKLLDLGLAKWDDETGQTSSLLTQLGSLMGTPDFIAPEQARNSHTSDIRADLYSLGCTFYWLLTGQVPFPNGSITEKLMQHQLDEPAPVEQVRRERLLGEASVGRPAEACVPSSVKRLLQQMLAKDPEDRPQTPAEVVSAVTELAQTLASARQGMPPTLPRTGEPTVVHGPAPSAAKAAPPSAGDAKTESFPALPPLRRRQEKRRRGLMVVLGSGVALAVWLVLMLASGRGEQEAAETPPVFEPAEAPVERAFRKLQARLANPKANREILRSDLVAFRAQFAGSAQAQRIPAMLMSVPSPLDAVNDPKLVPKWLKFEWQPPELLAILGDRFDKKRKPPLCLGISPEGRYLVTGSEDGVVRLYDAGQLPWPVRLTEHGQRVSCLALSPDGRTLATGAGDGAIIVWDLAGKHQVLQRLDAQKEVAALAFSPDGRTLASAGADGRIRFWSDGGRGRQTHTIVASTVRLLSLAYAPDGKRLVAGGADQVLRWWNVETKTEKPEGQLKLDTGWVKVAAFSPDGRTLVCGGGGDGTLHLCEVAGASLKVRQLLTKHTKLVHDLAFAPDGERFVSAGEDGAAVIWDAAAGKVVQAWTDLRYPVCGAAWAPDGRHVVLANTNSAIYVLRLRSPRGT